MRKKAVIVQAKSCVEQKGRKWHDQPAEKVDKRGKHRDSSEDVEDKLI